MGVYAHIAKEIRESKSDVEELSFCHERSLGSERHLKAFVSP